MATLPPETLSGIRETLEAARRMVPRTKLDDVDMAIAIVAEHGGQVVERLTNEQEAEAHAWTLIRKLSQSQVIVMLGDYWAYVQATEGTPVPIGVWYSKRLKNQANTFHTVRKN